MRCCQLYFNSPKNSKIFSVVLFRPDIDILDMMGMKCDSMDNVREVDVAAVVYLKRKEGQVEHLQCYFYGRYHPPSFGGKMAYLACYGKFPTILSS